VLLCVAIVVFFAIYIFVKMNLVGPMVQDEGILTSADSDAFVGIVDQESLDHTNTIDEF
jgi:ligand-binding sensor protein